MNNFADLQKVYSVCGNSRQESTVCGEHYRFTVLTPRLLRMEYSPDGVFEDRPSQVVLNRDFPVPEFRVTDSEDRLEIDTAAFRLVYFKQEFSSDTLWIDVKNRYTNYGGRWKYGTSTYGDPPRHHNLMGSARTLDKIDGATPLEFGLQDFSGRSWFDDSQSLLLTADGWFAPRHPGNTDAYFLCYGHDYTGALADFYRLTGAPPMVPRWALGNWWSRYWKYSEESYLSLMDQFRTRGIPFSVAVIDMDWHPTDIPESYGRGWTGYSWNRDLFPDPPRFLRSLHERGLHTSLNLHPADGVQAHEDAYPAMARDMGIDPASGEPVLFDAASERHWEAYFRNLIGPLEQDGVDFWWIDWQQGRESRMKGLDPLWALNHFHYLASCTPERRGMILSRYAGPGSHRYPFGFSGDTVATWASLAFQPYFTATAVNVGYGCWSHDIGGFKAGVRERELYLRWLQFGVFSPVMRMHASNNPFCSKEPWSYGEETADKAKPYFVLRHRLIPYLYTAMWNAHHDLSPALQPLYYHYPDAKEAYSFPNEYFFGPSLLVCPITSPTSPETGMAGVRSWIPDGLWTDVFSGRVYHGRRTLTLNREIDRMAVLAPAGAIVPLAGATDSNQTGNPETLDVYIFPGASGRYELYEDAGEGDGYRRGESVTTAFRFDWGETASLTVRAEGDLSLLPAERRFRLHFRGFAEGIRARNAPLQIYDPDTGTLTVETGPICRGDDLTLLIDGCCPNDQPDRKRIVFEFLMRAQLPVDMKTDIYGICKRKKEPAEIALALQVLHLPDAVADVLYELLFA